MNPILIKITIRRFCELFLSCAVISAIITFLHVAGILDTEKSLCIALLTGLFVFVFINVRMLRQCYFELRSNRIYFLINVSAYLIFTAVSLAVYYFGLGIFFTWVFAITKFAKYLILNINNLYSALIFHLIGLLVIACVPIGMRRVFEEMEEDLEE